MGFIDSYKHLEKLCGGILNDERKVSAYIDEMINTPRGVCLVRGWNGALKKLKHYRWVRNQIVHEPGCAEENMCSPEDALWLDDFYSRIMNQSDPLALYYKAANVRSKQRPEEDYAEVFGDHVPYQEDTSQRGRDSLRGLAYALAGVFIIIVLLFIISQVYFSAG